MKSIYTPAIRKFYHYMQLLLAPEAYKEDRRALAKSALEKRVAFYLLNDLNKSWKTPDTQENFTDQERKKWFGKSKGLTLDDISWEKVRQLLMPANVPNAVYRVNDALAGSAINECFSYEVRESLGDGIYKTDVRYMPRTVTVYENREHAVAAAKFLKILVKGSGATVVAEHIADGTKEGIWAVSDNMNLDTHNALRLFVSLLYNHEHHNFAELGPKIQEQTNKRLSKGEKWEVWKGMNEYLTLHGRPGVKMYSLLPDGKDDPEDIKRLKTLKGQDIPICLRELSPSLTMRGDGRIINDEISRQREISYLLFGEYLTDMIFDGDPRYVSQMVRTPITEAVRRPADGSLAGSVYAGTRMGFDFAGILTNYLAHGIASGAGISVSLLAMLTGAVTAGAIQGIGGKKYTLEGRFRQFVERTTGPLREAQFGKTWSPRQLGGLVESANLQFENHFHSSGTGSPRQDDTIDTPMGTIHVPPAHVDVLAWSREGGKNASKRQELIDNFVTYMQVNWNTPEQLKHYAGHDCLDSLRDQYAAAYADFVLLLLEKEKNKTYSMSERDEYASPENHRRQLEILDNMQKAATAFVAALHDGSIQKMPAQLAIDITKSTRASLESGLNEYLALNQKHLGSVRSLI